MLVNFCQHCANVGTAALASGSLFGYSGRPPRELFYSAFLLASAVTALPTTLCFAVCEQQSLLAKQLQRACTCDGHAMCMRCACDGHAMDMRWSCNGHASRSRSSRTSGSERLSESGRGRPRSLLPPCGWPPLKGPVPEPLAHVLCGGSPGRGNLVPEPLALVR